MISNCLTYQELSAYSGNTISVKEKEKLYQHISHCELCAGAVNGFGAIPFTLSDVVAIDHSIDVKVNTHASHSLTFAHALIASISIASIFGFYFLTNNIGKTIQTNTIAEMSEIDHSNTIINNELAIPKEEIKHTNKKLKKAVQVIQQKIFERSIANVEPLEPIQAEAIINDQVINKELLLPRYNSDVIYIYDLKVSDYTNLYFGYPKKELLPGGTPVYKEHKESIVTEMEEQNESIATDQLLKQGLRYFNKEQYQKALTYFNELHAINSNDVNALFYSALSYYNIDRFDKASTKLEELLKSNNNAFYQEAKWYLSLSESKRGNKQKAKELLEQIIAENGFYSKKAKEKIKAL